jgi:D-alanyl-D-alanine carboxypeptidase/D-alanyl-D-alanine-endopeptidase (penicillin-binding protein 4)
VLPTGDPTFFYSDFEKQPVADFFQKSLLPVAMNDTNFKTGRYASGWAWDEYMESYMPERSAFPVGGNNLQINFHKNKTESRPATGQQEYTINIFPVLQSVSFQNTGRNVGTLSFTRKETDNKFSFSYPLAKTDMQLYIPFVTNGITSAIEILNTKYPLTSFRSTNTSFPREQYKVLRTQPKDSLFKPMMHRSDNFFAEQTLLMASNEYLGYMSEEAMIDTMLKKDFADIPSKPRWVDGSGLSRYNLFTPNDLIYILKKLKDEFGLDRMKNILATGGEGTLKNYFLNDKGFIFAKTGTLSNNCALSGYLITKKGKLLLFSVIANNYQTGATPVRRAVEKFLQETCNQN